MPLEWKNTTYEKYSPDVELYHSQHATQYQACRGHSVDLFIIYKVKERMNARRDSNSDEGCFTFGKDS